jgi:hypothetical protein
VVEVAVCGGGSGLWGGSWLWLFIGEVAVCGGGSGLWER